MKKCTFFLTVFVIAVLSLNGIVRAQMVGANVYLQGHYLEIGMTAYGALGGPAAPASYHPHPICCAASWTPGAALAEVYDYGHDGWAVGTPAFMGDYTYPGSPFEGWELQVGGVRSQAFNPTGITGGLGLAGAFTSYSNTAGVSRATWVGTAMGGQLLINIETRLDTEASWTMSTVKLYNTGISALPAVYYLRTCDADVDQTWGGVTTQNSITYQGDSLHRAMVSARGTLYPQYMGLCATDSRAKVFVYAAWPMAAAVDLATVYGETYAASYAVATYPTSDLGFGLIFNVGDIAAGDSAVFSYSYIFSDTTGIDSVSTSLCGGTLEAGNVMADESTICATSVIDLTLTGASAFSTTMYQWQSSPDSAAWSNITGETATTYTLTGMVASTYYRCKVTCSESGASEFTPGVLIVFTPICPCIGMDAGAVSPSVTSACSVDLISLDDVGYTATGVTYQWQSSPDSMAWSDIPGAIAVPYSFTGLTTSTFYRLVVTCITSGVTLASAGQLITFVPCPCIGLDAGTVTPDVTIACPTTSITLDDAGYTATGATYQWQSSPDSASWSDVAGATTVPYTFTGLSATTYYRLVVTCISTGIPVESAGVRIDFSASCACVGLSAGLVIPSVTTACSTTVIALGDAGYTSSGTTLQWQASLDSATWSNIPSTTVPYMFSGLVASTFYRLVVTCTVSGISVISPGVRIVYAPCGGGGSTTGVPLASGKPASYLYPNPATEELTIQIIPGAFTSFTIANSIGQVMMQQDVTGAYTRVNIKALPAGLYNVTLKGANGREVRKFVKL